MALLLFAGLVYDGGQLLAAKRRADNEAAAAARAGAASISEDAFRSSNTEIDAATASAARAGALSTLACWLRLFLHLVISFFKLVMVCILIRCC